MKLKSLFLTAVLAASATSAYAGQFVTLTNGNGTDISVANGGLVNGATNPNSDKFYIENLASSEYLTGYEYGEDDGVIATKLDYRAFSKVGTKTVSTYGSLTLLDYRITENVELLPGVAQATIFDFVYRDSIDNKLVFGTRYLNLVDNDQEVNFLFRAHAGDNAAVAWTFATDNDLRMYQAGLTEDYSFDSVVEYDEDTVRQKADISVTEGNPWTGLYLVKTDAISYKWGANAIGFYQAGEEGQDVVGGFISGFVSAVPEPEYYAMMMLGLGVVGAAARRQKKQA